MTKFKKGQIFYKDAYGRLTMKHWNSEREVIYYITEKVLLFIAKYQQKIEIKFFNI